MAKRKAVTARVPAAGRRELLTMYALKQLPPEVRSDVLSARKVGQLKAIESKSMTTIGDHSVARSTLFKTFRAALRSGKSHALPLRDAKANLAVDNNGQGSVTIGGTHYTIANVDIAAEDDSVRRRAMAAIVRQASFSAATAAELLERAGSRLTEAQFFDTLEKIARSPAQIASDFAKALRSGKLDLDLFFVPHEAYWLHLLPALSGSKEFQPFVDGELAAERKARYAANVDTAFAASSRYFASGAIVRGDPFLALAVADRVRLLLRCANSSNPYSLVGAIELCSLSVQDDVEFENLGRTLLEGFVQRRKQVRSALDLFSTAFAVSLAQLRSHHGLRRYPPFWRRLAATAHANLIVDACGPAIAPQEGLVEWAFGHIGSRFFRTVSLESSDLPRWLPEWVSPDVLFADVLGRIAIIAERAPASWKDALKDALSPLEAEQLKLKSVLPSILEASLPMETRTLQEVPNIADFVAVLEKTPTPAALLTLRSLTYGYLLLAELPRLALKVVEGMLEQGVKISQHDVLEALKFSANIALFSEDEALAKATAQGIVVAASNLGDPAPMLEIVDALVVCSRVLPLVDRKASLTAWLIRLARAQTVRDVLMHLRYEVSVTSELDADLRSSLSRVLALTALGVSSIL